MRPSLKVAVVILAIKVIYFCALFVGPVSWDSSTELLFNIEEASLITPHSIGANGPPAFFVHIAKQIAQRLLIWDAVFFASLALHNGARFEHEYAFSRAWAATVRWAMHLGVKAVTQLGLVDANLEFNLSNSLVVYALTAALISTAAHLIACYVILILTRRVPQLRSINPYWVSIIYALSPAGIFLLSGYTESAFALLSFIALLLYTSHAYILAGMAFGLAQQLRSNGLIWGVMFTITLLGELLRRRWRLMRITRVITGGSILGLSFIVPQFIAFQELCKNPEKVSGEIMQWCSHTIPSIYMYVQGRYWCNGFLAYWTVGNMPNFAIALPGLVLLSLTVRFLYQKHMLGLAAVHSIIALGTLLFWNVQIVTRLASCLPGPAWYIASLLGSTNANDRRHAKLWITYFIVWTVTQATLYGAFLPPA